MRSFLTYLEGLRLRLALSWLTDEELIAMTVGSKIIEDAIKHFEKEGWPLAVVRNMDKGASLRVAILYYLASR